MRIVLKSLIRKAWNRKSTRGYWADVPRACGAKGLGRVRWGCSRMAQVPMGLRIPECNQGLLAAKPFQAG